MVRWISIELFFSQLIEKNSALKMRNNLLPCFLPPRCTSVSNHPTFLLFHGQSSKLQWLANLVQKKIARTIILKISWIENIIAFSAIKIINNSIEATYQVSWDGKNFKTKIAKSINESCQCYKCIEMLVATYGRIFFTSRIHY